LERIYLGFIRPLLEYGDIVWDSPADALDPLEAIQRNAARIVTGATARSPTEGLYRETAWEPLNKRREFHRLTLMYNIVNGKSPSYLSDLVPNLVGARTRYSLRNQADLDTPLARLNVYANSFYPRTSNLWNNLNGMVQQAPSIEAFKHYHSRLLPKKNPLYYYGNRFENMMHARLRMGNSLLKADLCNILHVIDDPNCPCGVGVEENAKHFFFNCPLYNVQRVELMSNLLPLVINDTETDSLLFGLPDEDHVTNLLIFNAVHNYIRDTKRFT
jgi:hypothetical protein